MKQEKEKKSVATVDERMSMIVKEGASVGFAVLLLCVIVINFIVIFFQHNNWLSALLWGSIMLSATISTSYSVTRNGHPYMMKENGTKARRLALVEVGLGVFSLLIVSLTVFVAFWTGKIPDFFLSNGGAFDLFMLCVGLPSIYSGIVILKQINRNHLEELEEE